MIEETAARTFSLLILRRGVVFWGLNLDWPSFPVLREEEDLKWKFDAIFRGGVSGLAEARGRQGVFPKISELFHLAKVS